jgi:hypothetical protein
VVEGKLLNPYSFKDYLVRFDVKQLSIYEEMVERNLNIEKEKNEKAEVDIALSIEESRRNDADLERMIEEDLNLKEEIVKSERKKRKNVILKPDNKSSSNLVHFPEAITINDDAVSSSSMV